MTILEEEVQLIELNKLINKSLNFFTKQLKKHLAILKTEINEEQIGSVKKQINNIAKRARWERKEQEKLDKKLKALAVKKKIAEDMKKGLNG